MIFNFLRNKDLDRMKRSSDKLKQKSDTEKIINMRLRVFFVVICLLFSALTFKLINLQFINNEAYKSKLESYTAEKQTFQASRGSITDRNGNILVQSNRSLSIWYLPSKNITSGSKEEWELAKKFRDAIGVNTIDISDRQLKDMHYSYLSKFDEKEKKKLDSLVSKEELLEIKKRYEGSDTATSTAEQDRYELVVQRMDTPAVDEDTKKLYFLMMRMTQSPSNKFKRVVDDATQEQIAYISEHKSDFPGFKDISSDWDRQYEYGDLVKGIVGGISTTSQGIPAEERSYYEALGYSVSDRIGTSGLEKYYNSYLAGTKTTADITYDENGIALLNETNPGKNGYDLKLSLDVNYQAYLDNLLRETIVSAKTSANRKYMDTMYAVAMDVKTGAVYASVGIKMAEDGSIYSYPNGTYLEQNRVGSIVKIATLYAGLNEGAVTPGEVINDAPMQIKGSDTFSSYQNYGPINDIQAIGKSSNIYMANIAIRLGHGSYVPNEALVIPDSEKTFGLMRSYYNMFGLGVKTELDVPDEEVGTIGATNEAGKLIHLAIGQYDTYTAMQVAQYAATIANNGKRIQPHFLDSISEVNDPSTIVESKGETILSTLKGEDPTAYLDRAREGMRQCVTSGFCGITDEGSGAVIAAKTGTAENDVEGVKTVNSTMIAYAPYDNPEIAIICIAPNSDMPAGLQKNICGSVVQAASKYYFDNIAPTRKK